MTDNHDIVDVFSWSNIAIAFERGSSLLSHFELDL
uniref:Uncharacterized protein n=1 Tax=Rhizophora mucronata TaxID=61149 RepID=A0A2P2QVS4_RHIMU